MYNYFIKFDVYPKSFRKSQTLFGRIDAISVVIRICMLLVRGEGLVIKITTKYTSR